MVRLRSLQDPGPQSYSFEARRSGAPIRVAWRRRAKRTQITKTPMEKARIAATRKSRKALYSKAFATAQSVVYEEAKKISETYGHKDADVCYRELMQRTRVANTKRSASRWNAFLREEVKRRNDRSLSPIALCLVANIVTDLPDGQRLKASGYVSEISAMWKAMSEEEKIARTSESLKHLEDYRENKSSAHHNNNASAFQDAQLALTSIKREVKVTRRASNNIIC